VHVSRSTGDHWLHIRQDKHHRWSLDEDHIYQYHLGGSLHPHIRWWEAMEVPRRSVQFVEVGEGVTIVSLACEDLAQIDDVADLVRAVGPTMIVTPLLDGPQLESRWAARYAAVLADDPGSAVLTLTSAGMARRSRPHGREPSPVIALWKDPVRGTREIALEPGAQGVLLTASADLTTRQSGDGRRPIDNCTEFFDVGAYQVRAGNRVSSPTNSRPANARTATILEIEDLTVLTSWAEAVAEAASAMPEHVEGVLTDAMPGASWRGELGLPEPSTPLGRALAALRRLVQGTAQADTKPTLTTILAVVHEREPGDELERVAHRVLRSALEQRHMRQMRQGIGTAVGRPPTISNA
jgi:hypothetical protein